MSTSISCSACGTSVSTDYCGKCGQKIGNKPVSVWNIISDLFSNYFSFERSGLATLIQLIARPRFLVENYYMGNKGYYSSPARLLIFSIVIFVIHRTFISTHVLGMNVKIGGLNGEYAFWLLFLPAFVIMSQLTFIRRGFIPALHIISITYISSGFFILLLIINDILLYCFDDALQSSSFLFYVLVVFAWNSWALSKRRKWWAYVLNTIIEILIFVGLLLLTIPVASITSD